MPEIAVVNEDKIDIALITSGSSKVYYQGNRIAVVSSQVADHGGHTNVTITEGSPKVYVEGKKVARKGDAASCGHTIATGRPKAFSN